MPTYNVNDYTGWKHLPIDGVVFFYDKETDADNKVTIRNIRDDGASWSMTALYSKGKRSNGEPRIIGYKLEGSITLLENEIDDFHPMMSYMRQDPVDIFISLKGTYANAGEITFRFNNLGIYGTLATTTTILSADGKETKYKIDFKGRFPVVSFKFNPTYTIT